MLITFTDFNSGNSLAVNPEHIVCVFTAPDEKSGLQTTVINMLNGNVAVTEEYTEVVGRIQSELR
jgi:uncharacterized protein YlzI (FlbEa/FlbD family)